MGESLQHYVQRRAAHWQEALTSLRNLKKENLDNENAKKAFLVLDKLSADNAFIQSRFPSHKALYAVRILYLSWYQALHAKTQKNKPLNKALLRLSSNENIRNQRIEFTKKGKRRQHHEFMLEAKPFLALAALIFATSALFGWKIIAHSPENIASFVPTFIMEYLQRGELWTSLLAENPVQDGSLLIINNIKVAALCFISGIAFGIPSIVLLAYNGWHLGTILASAHQYDLLTQLGKFVLPHGILEIFIIVSSGGLGLKMGCALLSRVRSDDGGQQTFVGNLSKGLLSLFFFGCWLMICGILESNISTQMEMSSENSFSASLLVGLSLFLAYFFTHHFFLRPRSLTHEL